MSIYSVKALFHCKFLGLPGNFVEKSCPSCELMNGVIISTSGCEEAAAANSTLAARGWDDVKVINCARVLLTFPMHLCIMSYLFSVITIIKDIFQCHKQSGNL